MAEGWDPLVRKCQNVGSLAGAFFALGVFGLFFMPQHGGTALTLKIALAVYTPIFWISGGFVGGGLGVLGGVVLYMVVGWLIGVIVGCILVRRRSRKL